MAVRLLLDECIPRRLASELPEAEVRHAVDMGWSGETNGRLLARMADAGFDGLLTTDTNLTRQQAIAGSEVFVIVMRARSNRLADLKPLAAEAMRAAAFARPGRVYTVGG